jgi:DNA invertase Pin-like site-specific DNA recombinase
VTTAFAYIRLSKWDETSTAPQRQREAIAKLCADRGWTLSESFEDIDASGYNGEHRPGLEAMLRHLGEVDAVVVYRIDRIARSSVGFARILEQLQKSGTELVATDLQVDSSPSGTLIRDLVARLAQFESDQLSVRAKAVMDYRRARGEHIGPVPFGFIRIGKGVEPDPETFPVLEQAAERYVAGESLRRISADIGIHHPNLAQRLRSDLVVDALPPALAASLVQTMAERGRTGTRAKRSLLGGLAKCATCGGGMTVTGTSTGWASYGCKPGHVYIAKQWLDDHVTAAVLERVDTGKVLQAIARRRKRPAALQSLEVEARLEMLEADFYELGNMPRDRYLARREGLLKRLKDAREAETDRGVDLPVELARNLSARWPDLSVHGRRQIISAVLERVAIAKATGHGPVDPSRVTLTWRA